MVFKRRKVSRYILIVLFFPPETQVGFLSGFWKLVLVFYPHRRNRYHIN